METKENKANTKNYIYSKKNNHIKYESKSVVNESLLRILNGTGIVFIGTMIGMILAFLARVLIVRIITQEQYGLYSLSFVIVSICVMISLVGLRDGSTRFIAFYRGRENAILIKKIILFSTFFTLLSSIILFILLYMFSDIISIKIFQIINLSNSLKMFSFSIPFIVFINIFISFFRGFDKVKPLVYFKYILLNAIFIFGLLIIIKFDLSYSEIIYSYVISSILVSIILLLFFIIKIPKLISKINSKEIISSNKIGFSLLSFSIPILAVTILDSLLGWTDILMLGYFKFASVVGLYNGALPIARLIPISLTSLAFIYVPIISGLYSKNQISEIKKTYQRITKLLLYLTLPLFFIIVIFPEIILKIIFGVQYIQASHVLQILGLGFIIHVFLGANGMTLIVLGRTKFLMYSSFVCLIFNLVLNYILIPELGIIGASIATISSLIFLNLIRTIELYHFSNIHPFTKNYLKSVTVMTLIICFLAYFIREYILIKLWMLPIFFILFIFIIILIIIFTQSLDKDDAVLLIDFCEKIGLKSSLIKNLIFKLCQSKGGLIDQ